jgi:hypothetical protein
LRGQYRENGRGNKGEWRNGRWKKRPETKEKGQGRGNRGQERKEIANEVNEKLNSRKGNRQGRKRLDESQKWE